MSSYPTISEVLAIHKYLIQELGGKSGLRDLGSLESALGRLTSGYYSSIEEEAAAMMESLSQDHPFMMATNEYRFSPLIPS